jgi:uncharacterized protein
MKQIVLSMAFLALARPATAQKPEPKFIADTLVVEAEGTYETDPDLATLTFDVSSQDKELKRAYDNAAQSMQRIVALAERNGLKKDDISTGVLTLAPSYQKDRKGKAKSYLVNGQIALKIHDFVKIGPLLDGAAEDGIADFRSLTYSLRDEEAAKEHAVAEAMRRAVGRANAALAQTGQKAGALRYASLDVKQLLGVTRLESNDLAFVAQVSPGVAELGRAKQTASLPTVRPEKITVTATAQCAFQIQ